MGRLRDRFPPRLADPLNGVKSHVARRNGMADPARERRRQRRVEREPIVGAGGDVETCAGSAAWNPGNILSKDTGTTTVPCSGVQNDGDWVCAGHFTQIYATGTQWSAGAHPSVTTPGQATVWIVNHTANAHDLPAGTAAVRCWKT